MNNLIIYQFISLVSCYIQLYVHFIGKCNYIALYKNKTFILKETL